MAAVPSCLGVACPAALSCSPGTGRDGEWLVHWEVAPCQTGAIEDKGTMLSEKRQESEMTVAVLQAGQGGTHL